MKSVCFFASAAVALGLLAGCVSEPPGAGHGPQGTIAYNVLVEASPPGARIFANGADIGNTPVQLKIFAKKDGRFHDFGAPYYVVQAMPLTTNQFAQARFFLAAREASRVDHVPSQIYFDMNQPSPPPPTPHRVYAYPGYPPPGYYGPPMYYGPPGYFGPYGPVYYYRRW